MEINQLKKITAIFASEIIEPVKLSKEASTLVNEQLSPCQFLSLLINRQYYQDAIKFLAHALPKREAVWWAHQCVFETNVGKEALDPNDKLALTTTKAWVFAQTESARHATKTAAQALEFATAASWAAMAAFWSGGSLTPQGQPEVMPEETLTAKAVVGSILLTALAKDPEHANDKYQHFLEKGVQIANEEIEES